jgi:hypothetical protein
LKTRVASLCNFRVAARRVETRHPHCEFPPSEYRPSSLRQPTSTSFLLSTAAPLYSDEIARRRIFLCSSSYSLIRILVHNSGARARWRFFSSGRLSTMRTTRVSWMQIRTTIAHMLILYSCLRGLPPDLQNISQGWPLGCAE